MWCRILWPTRGYRYIAVQSFFIFPTAEFTQTLFSFYWIVNSNYIKGDFCKPCECNGNIDRTDPGACDSVTGLCQLCLYDTEGDNCEKCKNWWYGDAIEAKNCKGNLNLIFSCPMTYKITGMSIIQYFFLNYRMRMQQRRLLIVWSFDRYLWM